MGPPIIYNVDSHILLSYCNYCCYHFLLFFSLPQPSYLFHSTLPGQLVYLINEQSFFIMTFNLSQEELIEKVHLLLLTKYWK